MTYEDGSESSVIGAITLLIRHDRLLYYTFIERATFLLYDDAKQCTKEINTLK